MTEYRYEYNDNTHTIRLEPQSDGRYLATIGDQTFEVSASVEPSGALTIIVDGRRIRAYAEIGNADTHGVRHHHVALLGNRPQSYDLTTAHTTSRRRGARAGAGSLNAPMPGQVIEVLVTEGDNVEQGQPLLILEAMKMEIRVKAPHSGTVTQLKISAGDTVDRGQVLAQVVSAEIGS